MPENENENGINTKVEDEDEEHIKFAVVELDDKMMAAIITQFDIAANTFQDQPNEQLEYEWHMEILKYMLKVYEQTYGKYPYTLTQIECDSGDATLKQQHPNRATALLVQTIVLQRN